MIKNITVQELKKIDHVNIIDIRSYEKYNNGHIPNSINIPTDILLKNPNTYLNKKEKYYIYCQRGVMSVRTCIALNSLGYNVINILGGYEAWKYNS